LASLQGRDTFAFLPKAHTPLLADDSVAQLWLHEIHLIDDDFNHTGGEASSTILLQADLHPPGSFTASSGHFEHELQVFRPQSGQTSRFDLRLVFGCHRITTDIGTNEAAHSPLTSHRAKNFSSPAEFSIMPRSTKRRKYFT
jgi:hypothetical protein